MEIESFSPVCISGNPSEEELVAISAAYASLLNLIGDKSGENVVETGSLWAYSSKIRLGSGRRNVTLPGDIQSFQRNMRIAARI